MKITKRQLRRVIKEELSEYGVHGTHKSISSPAGDRAVGLYFDTEMHNDLVRALRGIYDNAYDAAMKDIGDHLDAEEMVEAGLRVILAEFLQAYGRGS